MNIIIRTDASISIGTGHVMRCLTLADELKRGNAAVRFICREEEGNLIGTIEEQGYKVYRLPRSIDIETDKELTGAIIKDLPTRPDWLIIDHYDIDLSWESHIRKLVTKIMIIDDLADRQHDGDLLLNQNYSLSKDPYNGLLPEKCVRLLGPEYTLLRPQFLEVRKNLRKRTGELKRILIFMGGSDPDNENCKVLKAIQMLDKPDISIDVIIGQSNPHRDEVKSLATRMPNAACHLHLDNMAELMSEVDLSIGAGGTTTWERCSIGLPAIVSVIAENQYASAVSVDRYGAIINMGYSNLLSSEDYTEAIKGLDKLQLDTMSQKGLALVDAEGSMRVAGKILHADIGEKCRG